MNGEGRKRLGYRVHGSSWRLGVQDLFAHTKISHQTGWFKLLSNHGPFLERLSTVHRWPALDQPTALSRCACCQFGKNQKEIRINWCAGDDLQSFTAAIYGTTSQHIQIRCEGRTSSLQRYKKSVCKHSAKIRNVLQKFACVHTCARTSLKLPGCWFLADLFHILQKIYAQNTKKKQLTQSYRMNLYVILYTCSF
jgi:hypothetical protein